MFQLLRSGKIVPCVSIKVQYLEQVLFISILNYYLYYWVQLLSVSAYLYGYQIKLQILLDQSFSPARQRATYTISDGNQRQHYIIDALHKEGIFNFVEENNNRKCYVKFMPEALAYMAINSPTRTGENMFGVKLRNILNKKSGLLIDNWC